MFTFLSKENTGRVLLTLETQNIKNYFEGKKSINSTCHKAW